MLVGLSQCLMKLVGDLNAALGENAECVCVCVCFSAVFSLTVFNDPPECSVCDVVLNSAAVQPDERLGAGQQPEGFTAE